MRTLRFQCLVFACLAGAFLQGAEIIDFSSKTEERQITRAGHEHIVANLNIWSPDSQWIAYDSRRNGDRFDAVSIERVNVFSGEVREIYRAKNGANCGVATWHPSLEKVVFILGPENPSKDWSYGISRRRGLIVDIQTSAEQPLDAMNYAAPFVPGALRGGSHVHVFNRRGDRVSFTYDDEILLQKGGKEGAEPNRRNIAVSSFGRKVFVGKDDPRNHDGEWFSVVVSRTVADPRPGSDEISVALEEGWIGSEGYLRADGSRQRDALAFQGKVKDRNGSEHWEVFVLDLPEDLTVAGEKPLEGTELQCPAPPRGVVQRRITHTGNRKFPGVQGPRHWLRSAPDGSEIFFMMKDDEGLSQIFSVSPNGGDIRQITHNKTSITSTFTCSPDGRYLAYAMDGSICVSEVAGGRTWRLTKQSSGEAVPYRSACVFSPDGKRIAYLKRLGKYLQIFTVTVPDGLK